MFGLLISGRLVDTSFREVDPTHCVIDIADSSSFNYVVIFLTGHQPFPEGTGGAVYFCWPPSPHSCEAPNWQYLGMISNEKPSAIFKVGRLRNQTSSQKEQDMTSRFGGVGLGQSVAPLSTAQLGISIEPMTVLQGLAPATETEANSVPVFVDFSQKMVENLFNFASSYAISPDELRLKLSCFGSSNSETYLPFSSIQQWYTNFQRRLLQNPYFWRN